MVRYPAACRGVVHSQNVTSLPPSEKDLGGVRAEIALRVLSDVGGDFVILEQEFRDVLA